MSAPARIRDLSRDAFGKGAVRMIHFRICWSDSMLDWEAFPTREEATARANELVRPGETYVIAEVDGTCPRCESLTGLRDSALTGTELR